MATSFVREKHVTFPRKSEKELTELLKKYQQEVVVTADDLRNPEARWWQELLFVLLKKIGWINFDERDFINRVQAAHPANRSRVFLKLLLSYWSEIAQMAFFRPPLETLDLIRPTKERVAGLLSAFINLDAFTAAIPSDPNIESFSDILRDTQKSEEHTNQLQTRIEELESQVMRKKMEVAQNAERVYQLKCDADRVSNQLQSEKETFEALNTACDEKNDAIHTLDMKTEDLERRTGQLQSEIDRIRVFHVPDVDAFLQQPILLRNKLDDLRKDAAEAAKRQGDYMALIQTYQHLDEEIRACFAIYERNLKLGRELEELSGQLNAVEETLITLEAETKRKVEEHKQLSASVTLQERQQLARQRNHASSPVANSQSSQRSAVASDTVEDESEIKGRLEEGEALMKLLQQRERQRQQVLAKIHELELLYQEKRNRLAENHDQFIDCIRNILGDLVKEGLVPAPQYPEDEEGGNENAGPVY